MVLNAVARPRFDAFGSEVFSGKIGIFPLTTLEPTKCSSKNRVAGTLETKPILSLTKDVTRSWLIEKVLPVIRAKWKQGHEGPIYIQQDNARPHTSFNDNEFLEASSRDGFDIRLCFQPPNNPNLNVSGLRFFRTIQSLQEQESFSTIDELVGAVEISFEKMGSHELNNGLMRGTSDSYDDVLPLLCELMFRRWEHSLAKWMGYTEHLHPVGLRHGISEHLHPIGLHHAGLNGYMVTVTNLKSPSDKWRWGAARITVGFHLFICISLTIMVVDLGPGTTTVGKSVVHPVTIDLRGKVCELLRQNATRFLMDDVYRNLDPLQFEGPGVDSKAVSLYVEDLDYMGHIKELNNYLDKVRTIVKPGCSQDVLKAALSAMASVPLAPNRYPSKLDSIKSLKLSSHVLIKVGKLLPLMIHRPSVVSDHGLCDKMQEYYTLQKAGLLEPDTVEGSDLEITKIVVPISGACVDDVKFYQMTDPKVAKLFHIDSDAKHPPLVLLKKDAE
ncbi:transposase, Tc1-like protein [Tanacetum coccineum]|uniref:Transposase, Tc1-like protein n=1 Tax=Tanacetum coccineum TaxID=301880 RepID=A0ABQ5A431_9ASTR